MPLTSTDLTAAHETQSRQPHRARRDEPKRSSPPRKFRPSPKEACRASAAPPGFIGMVAPLGTPPAVIRQLSSEIAAIVARPDVQDQDRGPLGRAGLSDEATFGADLVGESAKRKAIIGRCAKRRQNMTYRAPVADIAFTLKHGAGMGRTLAQGGELGAEDVNAVLEEAGRFATDVLAPLNAPGDKFGTPFKDGAITMPPGWKEAYRSWAAAGCERGFAAGSMGWPGAPARIECRLHRDVELRLDGVRHRPSLDHGRRGSIGELRHGGTQADVFAQARVRRMDGHDAAHRAAGRLRRRRAADQSGASTATEAIGSPARRSSSPTASTTLPTTSSISFWRGFRRARRQQGRLAVPGTEVLVDKDGNLRGPNDVRAHSIEHKLGIHASPTCTMVYGDKGGAIGYLVGEENRGLACMFTMMNLARLSVGLQGVGADPRIPGQAVQRVAVISRSCFRTARMPEVRQVVHSGAQAGGLRDRRRACLKLDRGCAQVECSSSTALIMDPPPMNGGISSSSSRRAHSTPIPVGPTSCGPVKA